MLQTKPQDFQRHWALQLTFSRCSNLDALIHGVNTAGLSAFNPLERRMAPLSHNLAGIILPHNHFGDHIDSSAKTIKKDLEKNKIKFLTKSHLHFIWDLVKNRYWWRTSEMQSCSVWQWACSRGPRSRMGFEAHPTSPIFTSSCEMPWSRLLGALRFWLANSVSQEVYSTTSHISIQQILYNHHRTYRVLHKPIQGWIFSFGMLSSAEEIS